MMFALVVFGLVILYSVSGPAGYAMEGEHDSKFYLLKQIRFSLIGLIGALAISLFPMDFFKKPIIWGGAYIVSFVLLAYVAAAGATLNGATRWIKLGSSFLFQPSELVKVAIVISIAGYQQYIKDLRAKGKFKAKTLKNQIITDLMFEFLIPVGAAGVLDLFILFQPHFSCFLIVGFVVFMCMVSSGIRWWSWLSGMTILVLLAVVAVLFAFTFYREDVEKRFAHVFQRGKIYAQTSGDESVDVSDDEMRQVTNAHNALGSGGMWGRGLGNSRAKYNYVSEAQNDYIFSIYVEETGFVGGTVLLLMFLVTFAMAVMVILRANSPFARMLSAGCASILIIQVTLNIAVELQVIPSTGVTLPFISYGGTAQICLLLAYGMILGVSRNATSPRALPEEENDGV